MNSRFVVIIATIIISSVIVIQSVAGSLYIEPEKVKKNNLLPESDINILPPGDPAHLGKLWCVGEYKPSWGSELEVNGNVRNFIEVIWPNGTGKIEIDWDIDVDREPPFSQFLDWEVGFYLLIIDKHNIRYDKDKYERVIVGGEDLNGTLSVDVELNEKDFLKIDDKYEILCYARAEVVYKFLFFPVKLTDRVKFWPRVNASLNESAENFEQNSKYESYIEIGEAWIENDHFLSKNENIPFINVESKSSEVNWTGSEGKLIYNIRGDIAGHFLPFIGNLSIIILDKYNRVYKYKYVTIPILPRIRKHNFEQLIEIEIDISKGQFQTFDNKTIIHFEILSRMSMGFNKRFLFNFYDMDKANGLIIIN